MIFAMTLVFGKQKPGDVFQRKRMIMNTWKFTYLLHFVTGLSLIAQKMIILFGDIVQTKTKAVKAMIKKSFSSVTIAKPAYQKANLIDLTSYKS